MTMTDPSDALTNKREIQAFYDAVSVTLDGEIYGPHSYFLNYGYLSDGHNDASPFVAHPQPNHDSAQLVLETIGTEDLDGKRLLDVSCGRGGTIFTIKYHFSPRLLVGVDLSPKAINFDQQTHQDQRTRFLVADAESLPFEPGSFDVVTNIEAAHIYPNVHLFFQEVHRVLSPTGMFLFADLVPASEEKRIVELLQIIGFRVSRKRDITHNVLMSCDKTAALKAKAFGELKTSAVLTRFLAVPGTELYERFLSRDLIYVILHLQKV